MDFIRPLRETSRKNRFILHIVDYFSRYSWAYPTKNANVEDVIPRLDELFRHMPLPTAFYSDRGQHFLNTALEEYLKHRNISIVYSPSGASQSTDIVEKENDLLQLIIRKDRVEWDLAIPHAVRQLNTRIITYLKYSPIEILMGIPPAPSTSPSLPPPPPRDFKITY
jgi:transposase InsO family protein